MLSETQFHVPQLALFGNAAGDCFGADGPHFPSVAEEFLPVPIEMLELFEQMTGWVVELNETKTSYKRRQLPSMTLPIADGRFEIVDMSADWAAGRPTSHRAKCDRFIKYFSSLVTELQYTKQALVTAQSTIAAICPAAIEDGDAILVDSFIPRYDGTPATDRRVAERRQNDGHSHQPDSDFSLAEGIEFVDPAGDAKNETGASAANCNADSNAGSNAGSNADSNAGSNGDCCDLEVQILNQDEAENESHGSCDSNSSFCDDWCISGAPGYCDGHYVDKRLIDGRQLQLITGHLESTAGICNTNGTLSVESETILQIDLANGEYRFVEPPAHPIWLLDPSAGSVILIESSAETTWLKPGQAIIVTTLDEFPLLDPVRIIDLPTDPDALYQSLQQEFISDIPMLVVHRRRLELGSFST